MVGEEGPIFGEAPPFEGQDLLPLRERNLCCDQRLQIGDVRGKANVDAEGAHMTHKDLNAPLQMGGLVVGDEGAV